MTSDVELEVQVAKVMRTRDGRTQSWAFVWSSRPSTGESKHHLADLGPQPEPGEPIPLGPITTPSLPSRPRLLPPPALSAGPGGAPADALRHGNRPSSPRVPDVLALGPVQPRIPNTKSQQAHSAPSQRKQQHMNNEFVLTSVHRIRRGRPETWLYVRPVGQASQGPIIRRGTDGETSQPNPPRPDTAIDPTEVTS
jgi:hypothetical protein